ncbi:uncharacterized protein BX663DRAFT_547786 [Cokeromyces recurvatus]|uniref:uncharacterized protein n=1 Tax=Cokeromyces recurvatus TaxID=90255 RepID=UPI0022202880|nr:uncharacterized protein BX663DRAFT_547786 [Cokeromyces recurvatus]KAI7908170.1 hypothetical protein BX663DRAFT_547786 [Cokeromyces recurvatus]
MNSLSNKEKQILDSHREIIWLQRRIRQLEHNENVSKSVKEVVIPESISTEYIQESIEEYKRSIDELKYNLDSITRLNRDKEALTKSINSQYFTIEALYPKPSDHQQMQLKQSTHEQINRRDELVVQFMQTLNELDSKKSELTQLQRQIIKQHEVNRELTSEVNQLKSRHKVDQKVDSETMELLKAINDKKDQMSIIRSVLNGIILESGIPWEEDERWLQTILRIGEPLPLL